MSRSSICLNNLDSLCGDKSFFNVVVAIIDLVVTLKINVIVWTYLCGKPPLPKDELTVTPLNCHGESIIFYSFDFELVDL